LWNSQFWLDVIDEDEDAADCVGDTIDIVNVLVESTANGDCFGDVDTAELKLVVVEVSFFFVVYIILVKHINPNLGECVYVL